MDELEMYEEEAKYEQERLRWEIEQERRAHQRECDLIDDIRHGYAGLG
jgi:hypothetical protein